MLQEVHDAGAGVNPAPAIVSAPRFTAASPLTIVGWLWRQENGMTHYTPAHANTWARMIHRHLKIPHRFMLVTDHPRDLWGDFDPLIEPTQIWDEWRFLKNVGWGASRPHCYVRLKAFSREIEALFGPRFVSLDLDCVVLKNLDSLFDRGEDFVIFRRQLVTPRDMDNFYQGSMWMMTAGAREFIWSDFKGEESIKAAARYMGTDQAWMRHRLAPDEAGWTDQDGVYGFPRLKKAGRYKHEPPSNARIVFFYDAAKPWDFTAHGVKPPRCQQCGAVVRLKPPYSIMSRTAIGNYPWIAENYK